MLSSGRSFPSVCCKLMISPCRKIVPVLAGLFLSIVDLLFSLSWRSIRVLKSYYETIQVNDNTVCLVKIWNVHLVKSFFLMTISTICLGSRWSVIYIWYFFISLSTLRHPTTNEFYFFCFSFLFVLEQNKILKFWKTKFKRDRLPGSVPPN